ncbi:MAG: hypothetical protein KAH32_04140 [Chlamydiia bacterium]|nr:hypothetical protein [Chlamydiia bacterium]
MSDRKSIRKAIKDKKPVAIDEDTIRAAAKKNDAIEEFVQMISDPGYKVHMIIAAVKAGVIKGKKAAEMFSIYELPMFAGLYKENDILLADYAVEVLTRYKMSVLAAKKGELLTAFLVDNDEDLANVAMNPVQDDDVFGKAYVIALKRVQNALVDRNIQMNNELFE